MNPEQAWQSVLGQLQMEMPRASFDTWVRDTPFVSLEDGVFTVAARNEYARDWLESRLLSTVSRLLAGMLDQQVEVRLVVQSSVLEKDDADAADDSNGDGAAKDSAQEEPGAAANSVVRARISMGEYEQIVQPRQKVAFPAYFLRHIPRIGPEMGWIVIALHQLAFLRHNNSAQPIPAREIARWAGMSRRAFWRWSKRISTIPEFVDRHLEKVDGQRVVAYNVWADVTSCPLTPVDAKGLTYYLTDMLEQHGSPEQVVNAIIDMKAKEIRTRILPVEANFTESETGECVTVNELVQWLGWPPDLGEILEKRVMNAFGTVILTWHFVLKLLPELDHGPAWMVTILRDLCYEGEREQRSSTTLSPAKLARLCGLRGEDKHIASTLSAWLRKPLVQSMVADENLADRTLGFKKDHRYHVSFFDAILNPSKQAQADQSPQTEPGVQEETIQASKQSGITKEVKRHKGGGKVAQPKRQSGTGVDGKWHKGGGKVAQPKRQSGTPLNLFKPLNQSLLTSTNLNQPGALKINLAKTTSNGSVGQGRKWVLSEILRQCGVNPKNRDAILLNATAAEFLACLFYTYSPQGRTIENRINFVVSRVLDPDKYRKAENKARTLEARANAHLGPEKRRDEDHEKFRVLACLPPDELAHLLEQQYAAGQDLQVSPPNLPSWRDSGMNRLPLEAVRELASRLGDVEMFEQEPASETGRES